MEHDHSETKTKREEVLTYKNLKLGRELKSIARRKRQEASGKKIVLGDGSLSQPYLVASRVRYKELWAEAAKSLLLEAKSQGVWEDVDKLMQRIKPRIQALVYGQLAREVQSEMAHSQAGAVLDRGLTASERALFREAKGHTFAGRIIDRRTDGASLPGNQSAQFALDHVLANIAQRQNHNPAKYGAIWAELVGLDAASQTEFIGVDEATETAYFRCLNSVLSMSLQRRADLPKKLGEALGKRVRRLKMRF